MSDAKCVPRVVNASGVPFPAPLTAASSRCQLTACLRAPPPGSAAPSRTACWSRCRTSLRTASSCWTSAISPTATVSPFEWRRRHPTPHAAHWHHATWCACLCRVAEFRQTALVTLAGFAVLGFIGFAVKLVHIPLTGILTS